MVGVPMKGRPLVSSFVSVQRNTLIQPSEYNRIPMYAQFPLDPVRHALGDRDRRGVGVGPDDVWQYRGIDYAQALRAMHPPC